MLSAVTTGSATSHLEVFSELSPGIFSPTASVAAPGNPPLLAHSSAAMMYIDELSAGGDTIVMGAASIGTRGGFYAFRTCPLTNAVLPACACAPRWQGPTCEIPIRPPVIVAGHVVDDNDKDVIISAGDTVDLFFSYPSNGAGFGSTIASRPAVDALLAFDPPLTPPDGDYIAVWLDPGSYMTLRISIVSTGASSSFVGPPLDALAVRVIGTSFLAANGTSFPPDPSLVFADFTGSWGTGSGAEPGEFSDPRLLAVSPAICPLVGCSLTLFGSDFQPGCSVRLGSEHYAFSDSRLTYYNSSTLAIVTPSYAAEGYQTLNVTNIRSASSILARTMYFTDDCPQPGSFGRGIACRSCPEGAYCPGGFRMWPLPGYWTPNERVGWVEPCPEPALARCLGGQNAACGRGYTGDYCAECAEGYFLRGTECVSCGANADGIFAGLILANSVFYGAFIVAAVFVKDRTLSTISRAVITVQMIRGVAKMNTEHLSPELRSVYAVFALVTMDAEFIRPGCIVSSVFPVLFWANAALLASAIAAAVIIIAFAKIVTGSHRFYRNRLTRTVVILLAMMYLSLATYVLRGGYCLPGRDDKLRLVAEPSTVCYQGSHLLVAIVSYALILSYVIGYPLIGFFSVRRNTARLWSDPVFRSRYGYWYEQFKEGAYWFEFLQFGTYASLAICDSILMHLSNIQLGASLTTLAVYFLAVIVSRPFASPWKNAMEVVFTLVSLTLIVLNRISGSLSQTARSAVSALIFSAFVFAALALVLGGIIYLCYQRKTKRITLKSFFLSIVAQKEERIAGHDLTRQSSAIQLDASARRLARKMRARLEAAGAISSPAVLPPHYPLTASEESAATAEASDAGAPSNEGIELLQKSDDRSSRLSLSGESAALTSEPPSPQTPTSPISTSARGKLSPRNLLAASTRNRKALHRQAAAKPPVPLDTSRLRIETNLAASTSGGSSTELSRSSPGHAPPMRDSLAAPRNPRLSVLSSPKTRFIPRDRSASAISTSLGDLSEIELSSSDAEALNSSAPSPRLFRRSSRVSPTTRYLPPRLTPTEPAEPPPAAVEPPSSPPLARGSSSRELRDRHSGPTRRKLELNRSVTVSEFDTSLNTSLDSACEADSDPSGTGLERRRLARRRRIRLGARQSPLVASSPTRDVSVGSSSPGRRFASRTRVVSDNPRAATYRSGSHLIGRSRANTEVAGQSPPSPRSRGSGRRRRGSFERVESFGPATQR
ncbi:uncharacterized protein AMSG_11149 [Thecamonas trahens ATCC 50062]|uniref:TRP C-terminal domain-containing protein n=1 Tax=Thecamonas trahens ATCC 50062 TaxID=461836 RepID=A0A0L0DU80_THETB|nr:hypothetical protein AMSG_11149 [Thecamonas trahens ATCC 50062]KNC55752.1 hypothetical protein AMSG_11149 [Thecamonas trahens ATCC 50062]|eukprot:XP_013752905.1 hypothetical protein AMSG_11149 [Thecamonas trahens ATCC 50062]